MNVDQVVKVDGCRVGIDFIGRCRESSVVAADEAESALTACRKHPLGRRAAVIGRIGEMLRL